MTMDEYVDEHFDKDYDERFIFEEVFHPMEYKLIDNKTNQEYLLQIKNKDWFYYADEIIQQKNNRYVMYRESYQHYAIRDTLTSEKWMIPNKNTCQEIADRLNQIDEENKQLKKENKHLQCTIESNSQDDYIDYLEKQNERLKERIEELASNDKIVFMVNE